MESRGATIGLSWMVSSRERAGPEFSCEEKEQQKQKNKIKERVVLKWFWMEGHNV